MKEAIIVFGAGDNFVHHYSFLQANYHILAILDNSPGKQGMRFGEAEVVSLAQMPKDGYEKVIVTPNAFAAIIRQLKEAGVPGEKIFRLADLTDVSLASRDCRMAFVLNGGLGDYLISANYLHYLREKYFPEKKFDLYCGTGAVYGEMIFPMGGMAENRYSVKDEKNVDWARYALVMKISRYPEIMKADTDVLARFYPEMIDYLLACQKFRIFHKRFFQPGLMADGQSACLSEIWGVSRMQQPDIGHILGISEEYRYPLPMSGEPEKVLGRYGLRQGAYITLHRGADARYAQKSVKLWPVEKYNALLEELREAYPGLPVVQLGTEAERYPGMAASSRDLRGRTTLEETGALLQGSRVHIDNEGGLVHLRHAIGGSPSVVLFGPTSPIFFGYSENRNLRGEGCKHWCEWVTDDWQVHCPREFDAPPCMASISVSMVMEAVKSLEEGHG